MRGAGRDQRKSDGIGGRTQKASRLDDDDEHAHLAIGRERMEQPHEHGDRRKAEEQLRLREHGDARQIMAVMLGQHRVRCLVAAAAAVAQGAALAADEALEQGVLRAVVVAAVALDAEAVEGEAAVVDHRERRAHREERDDVEDVPKRAVPVVKGEERRVELIEADGEGP